MLPNPSDVTFYQCVTFDYFPQKWIEKYYTFFHLFFLYIFPLLVIIVCYTRICIESFSRAGRAASRRAASHKLVRQGTGNEADDTTEPRVKDQDQDVQTEQTANSSLKRVCISVDEGSKVDVIELENISNATPAASASGIVIPKVLLRPDKQHEVRQSILKQTFVIVAAFLVCWSPYVVIAIWNLIDTQSAKREVNLQWQDFLSIFAVSNSAVNPFIYGKFVRSDNKNT